MKIDKKIERQIIDFNKLFKKYDAIYQDLAGNLSLNRVQTGVLYTIEEFRAANEEICTQKDITDTMLYSKQSVNTAVKSLVRDGYLEFGNIEGNKKSKNLLLTKKGKEHVKKEIREIVVAENEAFQELDNTDRRELLFLFNRIVELLENKFLDIPKK